MSEMRICVCAPRYVCLCAFYFFLIVGGCMTGPTYTAGMFFLEGIN